MNKLPVDIQKYKHLNLKDMGHIINKTNENHELSLQFIDDVLRIAGYEIDEEGYIIDYNNIEDETDKPDYIVFKGKALRLGSSGVMHSTDMLFDPYTNSTIMEFLFVNYLKENHPQVSIAQIYAAKEGIIPKGTCTYGYMKILYENGAYITTGMHWRDSTKYLDGWCRLEAMGTKMITELLEPYDTWEAEFYSNPDNLAKGEMYK